MDKSIPHIEQQLEIIIDADQGLDDQSFFYASQPTEISPREKAEEFIMQRMLRVE